MMMVQFMCQDWNTLLGIYVFSCLHIMMSFLFEVSITMFKVITQLLSSA